MTTQKGVINAKTTATLLRPGRPCCLEAAQGAEPCSVLAGPWLSPCLCQGTPRFDMLWRVKHTAHSVQPAPCISCALMSGAFTEQPGLRGLCKLRSPQAAAHARARTCSWAVPPSAPPSSPGSAAGPCSRAATASAAGPLARTRTPPPSPWRPQGLCRYQRPPSHPRCCLCPCPGRPRPLRLCRPGRCPGWCCREMGSQALCVLQQRRPPMPPPLPRLSPVVGRRRRRPH